MPRSSASLRNSTASGTEAEGGRGQDVKSEVQVNSGSVHTSGHCKNSALASGWRNNII